MAPKVKNLPANAGATARSLGGEDALEEGIATHSSILAWRTPWTKAQSITSELDTTEQPMLSLSGATVHGVAKSQT